MRIEVLDVLAVVALAMIVLLAYVLISPTVIEQQTSALRLAAEPGTSAVFELNITVNGGYRDIALAIQDVHFSAPSNWSYSISEYALYASTSGGASANISISIPHNATLGSNSTLSFVLVSKSNPSLFQRSITLSAIASSYPFVEESGELLAVSVNGLSFVPWYAVVGPIAAIILMVGVSVALSKR